MITFKQFISEARKKELTLDQINSQELIVKKTKGRSKSGKSGKKDVKILPDHERKPRAPRQKLINNQFRDNKP